MSTFTVADLLAAQRAMRAAAGEAGEENFPLPAFVGMVSDEVEALRAAGRDDDGIAALIADATGKPISADDLRRFYADPAKRGHSG